MATSLPNVTKQAILIARHWRQVPDAVSNDDALAQGIITPEMLQLIMQIVQDLMQNCLSNNQASAWSRVVNYGNGKPMDRLGDDIRLNWIIDRWMVRLGIPRETGDVVIIRKAITETGTSLKPEDFDKVQMEILFYTV